MKRLCLFVLMFLFVLTSQCFGAGSFFKVTGDEIRTNFLTKKSIRILTLSFQGDSATGAIPNLTLTGSGWTDGTNSGSYDHGSIMGWWGWICKTDGNHAGTEPSEDSEIYIYQRGIDLLGGNGVDQVDNTAEREIAFYHTGSKATREFEDTLTVTATQQAAAIASATGTVIIIMTP